MLPKFPRKAAHTFKYSYRCSSTSLEYIFVIINVMKYLHPLFPLPNLDELFYKLKLDINTFCLP